MRLLFPRIVISDKWVMLIPVIVRLTNQEWSRHLMKFPRIASHAEEVCKLSSALRHKSHGVSLEFSNERSGGVAASIYAT
jgi:hypothetical protein